ARLPSIRQRLRDPVAARGLAVGPGHADRRKPRAGVAADPACDLTRVASEIFHAEVGSRPLPPPLEAGALPQHARSTDGKRRPDVVPPIVREARIGDERVAGSHRAAVVREAPYF